MAIALGKEYNQEPGCHETDEWSDNDRDEWMTAGATIWNSEALNRELCSKCEASESAGEQQNNDYTCNDNGAEHVEPPNGSRLSCGAERERSQIKDYHNEPGRRQLQALVRLRTDHVG